MEEVSKVLTSPKIRSEIHRQTASQKKFQKNSKEIHRIQKNVQKISKEVHRIQKNLQKLSKEVHRIQKTWKTF